MGKADDDLIQRLKNAHENSQQRIMGSNIFGEAASALEEKDAEIVRLKLKVLGSTFDENIFEARAIAAESRVTSLERQLAEETERCAKFRALLVRVNALAQTPAWKRMPDGGLFSSTPLAGDIAAALAQSKEK